MGRRAIVINTAGRDPNDIAVTVKDLKKNFVFREGPCTPALRVLYTVRQEVDGLRKELERLFGAENVVVTTNR